MKGVLKVSVIMPVLLICIFLLFSNIASTAADPAWDALVRFADRILTNQMPDGAIIMGDSAYPPPQVVPYFSNLAAHGLMRAHEITYNPRYLKAVQAWTIWYAGYQNADGTICDF
jgi:hypothetical protein